MTHLLEIGVKHVFMLWSEDREELIPEHFLLR